MPTQTDICNYLAKVRKAKTIKCVNRDKNRRARYSLKMDVSTMEEVIRNIRYTDYFSGPHQDYDSSRIGDVWIFKPLYNGTILYVKIKMEHDDEVKVLSIHEDE